MPPVSMTALLVGGPRLVGSDGPVRVEIVVSEDPPREGPAERSGSRPAETSGVTAS